MHKNNNSGVDISAFGVTQTPEIRVVVLEPSSEVSGRLTSWLQSDERMKVVKVVTSAKNVLEAIAKTFPDVVLVGHSLPSFDGFAATRLIMETSPLPVVVYTNFAQEANAIAKSTEAGAVACIENPVESTLTSQGFTNGVNLLDTVRLMSEVRVIRRRPKNPSAKPAAPGGLAGANTGAELDRKVRAPIVAIGASTGGPLVLQLVLAALPEDFPMPILIVQHIAKGFLQSMTDWLRRTSKLPVQIAAHGVLPQPGHVYLAPDDFHMGLSIGGRIILSRAAPENGVRPSVEFLFRSIAELDEGASIGVLLTGMGKDGACELKHMHDKGCATVVQDAETSVVHGMPGEAISLGAADQVLPADRIAAALVRLVRATNNVAQ